MSVLREGSGTRWPTLAASAFVVSLIAVTVGLLFWLGGGVKENASAAGGGSTQFSLAQWADTDAEWRNGDLNSNNSAYHEGESIPYRLKIENAVVGTTYNFQVRYDCDKDAVNAFDFLTRYDRDRGTAPATALGLDPANPTGTAPINDDPTHAFDAFETARTWRLWGATFNSTPTGPTMADGSAPIDCASTTASDEKRYDVNITATGSTIYLLWGGHLASGFDWGCRPGGTVGECPPVSDADGYCAVSLGACGISGAPFHQAIDTLQGTGSRDRSIQPGAILPPRQPALDVTKTCTPVVHVGDTIFWSGTVTNADGISLRNVTLTDDNGTPANAADDVNVIPVGRTDEDGDTQADDLADGASATWSHSRQVTAGDSDPIVNTIYASAVDAFGRASADSAACTTDIIHPDIAVVKECTAVVHEGEVVDVTATVTNPGDTPLANVSVTDSLAGALTYVSGDTNTDDLLDTGETWVFAGSYIAPAGTESLNTVTAEGTDFLADVHSTVQDTDDCRTVIVHPQVRVVKECTAQVQPGDEINVTATVTNEGDVVLHNVVVTDSLAGTLSYQSGDTNTDGQLDLTEVWLFTGSYTAPEGDTSSNTVTVTALNTNNLQVEFSDGCTTDILNPDLAVVKECTSQAHPGDEIDVTATVTNPGDTPLSDVAVSDSLAGALSYVSGDTNTNDLLDPGEAWLFSGSYTAPEGDSSSNTVTATAMDGLEREVEATDDCTTDILNPEIVVEKQCTSIAQIGDLINVTATVTNPGDTPLSDVVVSDDLAGALSYVAGDDNSNDLLDPGETWTFTGSHIATDAASITDTVTAQGTDVLERTVSDDASCRTEIDHLPVIEVAKTADGNDPDTEFSDEEATGIASTVTFRVVIDNDSSEPVTITSLLDDTFPGIVCRDSDGVDVIGQTLEADDGDGAGSMNGGPDEVTCTFQALAPSAGDISVTDVVTVEAMDRQENTVSGQDDATITTVPQSVLGPTPTPSPTPVASPAVLPPTGGLGALTGNGSTVILSVLLALGLIGGGAWVIWSSRRWDSRRGSRS